jgi:thiol-disulfide isomerase/thioredoxin
MQKLTWVLLLIIPINFYGQPINFDISGSLTGLNASKLIYINGPGLNDSIEVSNDNRFNYKGTLSQPGVVSLYAHNTNRCQLWINQGNVQIDMEEQPDQNKELKKILKIHSLKGQFETSEYYKLQTILASLVSKKPSRDMLGVDSLMLQFYPFVRHFISNNRKSYLSAFLASAFTFTLENKNELYSMMKDNPDTFSIDFLKNQVERMKLIQRGKVITNFVLPTPTGDTVELYSLKERFVLIQFWSSSCAPCRWEHPHLIKLYSKYHSKGLEILGISLDNKLSDWVAAITQDNLLWKNVSDLSGWENPIVKKYKINYIPFNILIDSSHAIIAANLYPDQLEEILIRKIDN